MSSWVYQIHLNKLMSTSMQKQTNFSFLPAFNGRWVCEYLSITNFLMIPTTQWLGKAEDDDVKASIH